MSIERLKELAISLKLDCQEKESGITQFWIQAGYSFIELKHLYSYLDSLYDISDDREFINKNEYCISLKYIFRSWHAKGNRTDLNVISSIITCVFLRVWLNSSFHMTEISHPVIEDELYGVELIPSQPFHCVLNIENKTHFKFLENLIVNFFILNQSFYFFTGCLLNISDEISYSNEILDEWLKLINKNKNIFYSCNSRTNPKWLFYKDGKYSIIKSKELVTSLQIILKEYNIVIIEGINGLLFVGDNINNIIYHKEYKKALSLLHRLEEKHEHSTIVALDNFSILLGIENIVIFKNDGSLKNFLEEKELLKERHNNETKLLFSEYEISIKIDSQEDTEEFENLILDLLKKEKYIYWARKVSPTNQPDNGRDILCKFNPIYNSEHFIQDSPTLKYEKMIVQCKTIFRKSKKQSIGKTDVDVADTIFEYKPKGYMLVTNTQITARLTEYLETIATREGIYIDWWNKEDIEERIMQYPELIQKYNNILIGKRRL
ncbi:restriction endonuclease [Sulfurospirillum oryzae]|uniref:restriction endonuclease n=1 Tax=Sulfurospirillum oryzae TaxID=2976535 RepID=UPI0021E6E515|nr:restriction endonuclease [Sulfurospirillum oryzae]